MKRVIIRQAVAAVIILQAVLVSGCVKPNRQPDLSRIFRSASQRTGKTPIIIIPGILGSRLMNKKTQMEVWPRIDDGRDIELPISTDLKNNTDDLVATEVVVSAKIAFLIPEFKVYEDFIETLNEHAGYRRGNWDNPAPDGDQDTFYLFSYDWRRDNVETAQLLAQKIARLKEKLNRPNLQFNVIAHSMGGLIARYYLMYGGVDVLDQPDARVTWAGARHINKLVMVGTPNDGTMDALRTLVEGYSIYGGDRKRFPFFRKVNADTAFTMPSVYQLLPHRGTEGFYDAQMQPVDANIFDIETWRRYHWSIFNPAYRKEIKKKFRKEYDDAYEPHYEEFFAEREVYLKVVLARALAFGAAMDRVPELGIPLKVFAFAGDCEPTLRAPVLIEEDGRIKTIFHSRNLKFSGTTFKRAAVEAKMFEPGDGRVTRRSVLAKQHEPAVGNGLFNSKLNLFYAVFGCEIHGDLPNNPTIQNNLLSILVNDNLHESGPSLP